jgi:hypothetical protein
VGTEVRSPAPEAAAAAPPRWLARETRIGRHLYPLRAIGVVMAAGAGAAVVAVLGAVALLAT